MRQTRLTVPLLALLWLSLAPVAAGQQETEAEVALRRAVNAEIVQGDLEHAITLYEQIVERYPRNHPVAGRALLNLGRTYEKLGSARATAAYQRVLADYADQRELVSEARERLATLRAPTPEAAAGPVERVLLTDADTDINDFLDMHPSPDGRFVAHTRVGSSGVLYLRNLATGDTSRLADGYVWHPVWSPDGRRIAYQRTHNRVMTVEIVDVASGRIDTVPGAGGLEPQAWSRDGMQLLCSERDGDLTYSLHLVSVRTGRRRTLVAGEAFGRGGTADLAPDGRYVAYTSEADDRQQVHVIDVRSGEAWRLTTDPVGARAPVWSPDGGTIMYENQDGAWAIPIRDGRPAGTATLLRSRPFAFARWIPTGDLFYTEMQSSSALYRIPVDAQTGHARGAPERMPLDVDRGFVFFAWSPDMTRIAMATNGEWRATVLTVASGTLATYPLDGRGQVNGMWWSADGSEIHIVPSAFPRSAGTRVLAVSTSSGATREVVAPVNANARARVHISPNGQDIIYYRRRAPNEPRELVISTVGGRDERVLASDADPEGGLANWVRPEFSPDGSHVLFGRTRFRGPDGSERPRDELQNDETWEFSLWVVSTDGSGAREIATSRFIQWAAWDPSGRFVAYSESRGDPNDTSRPGGYAVMVADVGTGTAHEIATPGLLNVRVQAWSPDGRWIGVQAGSGKMELRSVRYLLGQTVPGR